MDTNDKTNYCQWENCSGGEYCEKHSLLTPPLETGGWEEGVYMYCLDCYTWGNPLPNDDVCGNCGMDFNTTLYVTKAEAEEKITHTTKQTERTTILELLSLMQAMPINERMGMPRHLVAIDLHKYAKSKGISLSEQPLEKK